MLSLRVTDPSAAWRSRLKVDPKQRSNLRSAEAAPAEGEPFNCLESISTNTGGLGEDDFLEETVHLDYFAALDCNFYLASIQGVAGVLDRSPDFNGERFDGRVLATGTPIFAQWDYQAFSAGSMNVLARDYNGGRTVEGAFELYLQAPEGLIWGACNPVPGLRYLACDGLGTDLLHIVMGTGPFGTGMTRACRDLTAGLDDEQRRLRVALVPGTAPASTQILRRIANIKNLVTSFKKQLCAIPSGSEDGFADARGRDLWETAVQLARNGAAAGDDRPLYWARLSMTAALSQRRPAFAGAAAAVQIRLDRASRGMTSHDFQPGSARKVFISGFDPFQLDGAGIFSGNPSGAAALRLDGTTVGGAQVQAVVFPVRYAEFNARLVEEVFRPHLQGGAQQASLITTVSMGSPGKFDLEVYNGRRRASPDLASPPSRDNRNALPTDNITNPDGSGTYNSPMTPPVDSGAQFVATTLPVHKMRVGTPYPVVANTIVHEQSPPGAPSAPHDGPTLGSTAVHGGGGGFLSNEIAYRVTRLRDELGVTVPAGHVHTPRLTMPTGATDPGIDAERNTIVNQYIVILTSINPIDSAGFFVRQHYLDFLNHEPDTGGLAYWTSQITQCRVDAACIAAKRVDVSLAFWYSSEFLQSHPGLRNPPGTNPDFNNAQFVEQSYLTYLRRTADPGGFAFWLGQLNSNNDYYHIAEAFLVSTEYRARFGPA